MYGAEQYTIELPLPPVQSSASPNERRDAALHRQRILAAARELFIDHGVDAVSMHQIARAANVGQGTLYRRFAHKGMLCLALLEESRIRFQQEMLTYIETKQKDTPTLELLLFLFAQLITYNEENGALLGAAIDAAQAERRTDMYHNPIYTWLREVVSVLLQRAIARKEIAPLDIEYTADIVLRPLAVDFYLYQRYDLKFSRERIYSGLRYFLFHGLQPRTTENPLDENEPAH